MPKSKSPQKTERAKTASSSFSRKNLKLANPSLTLLPNFTRKSSITSSAQKDEFADKTMRAYIVLAESCNWKNADGSIFPISVVNLCNYIRTKRSTNNLRSIKWYLTGFKKYHQNFFNNREWDAVCKHPDVMDLLNEYETESTTKRSHEIPHRKKFEKLKKVRGQQSTNRRGKKIIEKSTGINSVELFTEAKFPSGSFELTDSQICGSQGFERFGSISTFMDTKIPPDTAVIEGYDGGNELSEDDPQIGNGSNRKSIVLRRSLRIGTSKSEDCEEPVSFKNRFKIALAGLKAKYSGYCNYHPEGCLLVGNNRHFVLTERLFKRWASLCASGEDVSVNCLPDSENLTEFSVKNAVWMI